VTDALSSRYVLPLLALLALAGCSSHGGAQPRSQPQPVSLQVQDWRSVSGYAYYFEVKDDRLEIVQHDDYGTPPKIVRSRTLSAGDRQSLAEAVAAAKVDTLPDHYTDPNIIDGQAVRFAFHWQDGKQRKIELVNQYPAQLNALVNVLNSWSPPKYRIRYGATAGGDTQIRLK
jgi:hypothetical protein